MSIFWSMGQKDVIFLFSIYPLIFIFNVRNNFSDYHVLLWSELQFWQARFVQRNWAHGWCRGLGLLHHPLHHWHCRKTTCPLILSNFCWTFLSLLRICTCWIFLAKVWFRSGCQLPQKLQIFVELLQSFWLANWGLTGSVIYDGHIGRDMTLEIRRWMVFAIFHKFINS